MKKMLALSGLLLFMLTGCGAGATNTMSCSYQVKNDNLTSKITYDIDYEKDEVKKVRITYKYHQDIINDTDGDGKNDIDGVGTGTDGTTNDTQVDNDGIIDGVIGSTIDGIVGGVTDTILDIAGIRDRHTSVLNTYGNIPGFSVQDTMDNTDNDYKVTYVIDFDTISDNDLALLNLSRDITTLRSNYTNNGFYCSE